MEGQGGWYAAGGHRPEAEDVGRCGAVVPVRYYHLSRSNAPRLCGECGEPATAYVHGTGFRCGECAAVPAELADGGNSL